jgi:hypothetical protein
LTPKTFPHYELDMRTQGRARRMRTLGAPEWLIEAEQDANRDGYTMRRVPGCGPTYYRVPLATPAEELELALRRQAERLSRESEHQRMPGAGAYLRPLAGYRPAPDEWSGDFEEP